MTDVQIIETLQEHFAKEHNIAAPAADDSLLQSGILDSLGIVKLLSFVEEEFDVEIADADFDPENFESLRSISKLILENAN